MIPQDEKIFGEAEFNLPVDTILIKHDWPEKTVDLAQKNYIFKLNASIDTL